jgi:hypothetical protein
MAELSAHKEVNYIGVHLTLWVRPPHPIRSDVAARVQFISQTIVDASRVAALRARGASWRDVCEETGLSKGTAQRAVCSLPKIV